MVLLPVIPNMRAASDAPFADRGGRLQRAAREDGRRPRRAALPAAPGIPSRRRTTSHIDTYDGTHPNAAGEHKIAEGFAEAMYQAWDLGAPYAAVPS